MSLFFRNKFRILLLCVFTFLRISSGAALNYTVIPSDTLYGLSRQFDVPVNWLIRANSLENDNIHPGETLKIPVDGIRSLEVRPGDTLSALALEFQISLDYLRRFNKLENDDLKIGQKISIPQMIPSDRYQVLPGDTLLGIAIQYGLNAQKLRIFNKLKNDTIHPGQLLIVQAPRPDGHTVKNGESLWTIARDYGLSM
ncbi:MAG: LysM peptidoglycan-binding domain-containing protein, partial [Spirochaetaceae bacterium]|nr:LysM peptidoglycan-binding domain-containing protein [Spirochaetaceae bacterium]